MKDMGAAADCHVPNMGLPISDGWIEGRKGDAEAKALDERLRTVVLDRIVPRLAMIHRDWKPESPVAPPSADDIEAFGRAVLADDDKAAERLFHRLRARGFGADELFEGLLAPAARRFGELWSEDECDFVDVAVGVNRLRMVLERYADVSSQLGDSHRRALLIAGPEERHLFGLEMVAVFLRASGWDVSMEIGISPEQAGRLTASSWFAVAGVTVSNAEELDTAARVLASIRRASCNASIGLIAGGFALHGRPDLAARIGAHGSADDAPSAALLAQKLYVEQVAADAPSQSFIHSAKASN